MKLKKNTNIIIIELALSKELKPYLVLYQYLNCLLKASITLLEMSSLKLATLMLGTPIRVKNGGKLFTPVTNSNVRYFDIV